MPKVTKDISLQSRPVFIGTSCILDCVKYADVTEQQKFLVLFFKFKEFTC